jgi:hypothetical protein
VSDETEISLTGVSCEVCKDCGALPLKVEKGLNVYNCCSTQNSMTLRFKAPYFRVLSVRSGWLTSR